MMIAERDRDPHAEQEAGDDAGRRSCATVGHVPRRNVRPTSSSSGSISRGRRRGVEQDRPNRGPGTTSSLSSRHSRASRIATGTITGGGSARQNSSSGPSARRASRESADQHADAAAESAALAAHRRRSTSVAASAGNSRPRRRGRRRRPPVARRREILATAPARTPASGHEPSTSGSSPRSGGSVRSGAEARRVASPALAMAFASARNAPETPSGSRPAARR